MSVHTCSCVQCACVRKQVQVHVHDNHNYANFVGTVHKHTCDQMMLYSIAHMHTHTLTDIMSHL